MLLNILPGVLTTLLAFCHLNNNNDDNTNDINEDEPEEENDDINSQGSDQKSKQKRGKWGKGSESQPLLVHWRHHEWMSGNSLPCWSDSSCLYYVIREIQNHRRDYN